MKAKYKSLNEVQAIAMIVILMIILLIIKK